MARLLTGDAAGWVGKSAKSAPLLVTTTNIAQYAHAIGARDRRHFDAEAARAVGYSDVVAPLSFLCVVRYTAAHLMPVIELNEDGMAEDLVPPSRATRRLAGDTRTVFHRPLVAGDAVIMVKTIVALEEKSGRSGDLVLVTYALSYRDQAGHLVAEETFVRILR